MTGTVPGALTGGLREGLAAARRGWRPPSPQGDTGSERRGHSPQTTQPACCWVLTGVQAMGTEHGSGSLVLTPGDERGRHRNRARTGGRWESSLSPRRSEIGAHALAPHGRRWGRAPETRDGQTCRTGRQRRKPTWSMRSHGRPGSRAFADRPGRVAAHFTSFMRLTVTGGSRLSSFPKFPRTILRSAKVTGKHITQPNINTA